MTEPASIVPTEAQVLADVKAIIADVMGEDFVDEIEIGGDTSFNADLEVESIEFVALAEILQDRYGERVDFAQWMASMEVDEIIALTVGELVDFILSCHS